jgi:O2-independent ubiquinone biosynthesis protein UbiU
MAKAFASHFSTGMTINPSVSMMELVCLVQSLASLRAAIDNGADCVQINASPGTGLHSAFRDGNQDLARGLAYARFRGCRVVLSLEGHAQQTGWTRSRELLDQALAEGIDTLLLNDSGLMLYAVAHSPSVRLHRALDEASLNTEAILCLRRQFGVSRIVMPRVVSMAQIAKIRQETSMEIQVFGFGQSCSLLPAPGAEIIDAQSPDRESGSLPSDTGRFAATIGISNDAVDLCASVEQASNDQSFANRGFASAATLRLLPELRGLGVNAVRLDVDQYSPSQLGQVIRVWREAIDVCEEDAERFSVRPSWLDKLNKVARNLRMG